MGGKMPEKEYEPGEDRPISSDSDLTVLRAIRAYKEEAEQARSSRMDRNDRNFKAYLGEQDFSQKTKGQSKEFLPKVPIAVEQISAFIKKSLVQFGDWFDADIGKDKPLTAEEIKKFLRHHFEEKLEIPTFISDAIKLALLNSLIIAKVVVKKVEKKKFRVEEDVEVNEVGEGEDKKVEVNQVKKLVQDTFESQEAHTVLVNSRDYYPDPTGNGLYEIMSVERDLYDVVKDAKAGHYELEAVRAIEEDYAVLEKTYKEAHDKGQDIAEAPAFRKKVVIDEIWGTLLNADGTIAHENVVAAMANDKYLIKKPTPNPNWDGESPFIVSPIIRVPFSVWHKALFDHSVDLNFALNELFNLMLDGALASVWGVRQVRAGDLADPTAVAEGIPQGETLVIKDTVPLGTKVVETVTTGDVPKDALAMYNLMDREWQVASITNDLKLGLLPPKQVKATEIIEASQQIAVLFDGMVADIETKFIKPMLEKVWHTTMQLDDLDYDEINDVVGERAAAVLRMMSPEERYAMFADCSFKVTGLSAVLARIKDFQKLMALLSSVNQSPMLMQSFVSNYSTDKVLEQLIKTLNINPESIKMTDEEKQQAQEKLKQLPMFQQLMSGKKTSAENTGGPSLPSEINQMEQPTGGF
jgi:hypothetical protein